MYLTLALANFKVASLSLLVPAVTLTGMELANLPIDSLSRQILATALTRRDHLSGLIIAITTLHCATSNNFIRRSRHTGYVPKCSRTDAQRSRYSTLARIPYGKSAAL